MSVNMWIWTWYKIIMLLKKIANLNLLRPFLREKKTELVILTNNLYYYILKEVSEIYVFPNTFLFYCVILLFTLQRYFLFDCEGWSLRKCLLGVMCKSWHMYKHKEQDLGYEIL